MAWMTADGETGRMVWADKTNRRTGLDGTVRLVNGKWVRTESKREPMADWRAGSSRVVNS